MQRIVVGFDGSDHSRKALERAAHLATGAELTVVCAAGISELSRHAPGETPVDPKDVEARTDALAAARSFLDARGMPARYVEGHGSPADVIVDEAEDWGADLIVVGTRGLHGGKRLLLGSVSTKVVHHAPCDVLVVR
jgi:nucleotide-binding universal stress UspA family protein